ncbi:glycosyltransferase family protein [Gelidibacter sediminis]|nr:hypothetical protein [Gelidibacter sediminis]
MRKNRSDAVHIMNSCSGFSQLGINVDLITPKVERENYQIEYSEIFNLYNIKPNFNIIELPTKFKEDGANKDSNLKFGLQKFKESAKFAFKNRNPFKYDIVYSKCFISSVPILILKKLGIIKTTFIFEAPYLKNSFLHNFIVNNSDYIVVGSSYLESKLKSDIKLKNKIIKTPRRYYFNENDQSFDKMKLREKFGFLKDYKYILYAGKVAKNSNEINHIIYAAKKLPEFKFVLVGVNKETRAFYESFGITNLILFPFQTIENYEDIIRAADVLVGYYTDNEYNRYYLGPGKTSSYFKSKNPVIYSDLPSLRDRYTDEMVYFLKPDEPDLLVDKIKFIVNSPKLNEKKTALAYDHIVENTYAMSKTKILEEIQRREQEK